MANLAQLPVELLLHIGASLCCDWPEPPRGLGNPSYVCRKWPRAQGHRNLSRLSRTCTRLRDVLQPAVFASFERHDPSRAQQLRLLEALERRPDLARNMRLIGIDKVAPIQNDLSDAEVAAVSQRIANLYLGGSHLARYWKWEHAMPLVVVELILLRTPNLARLDLPLGHYCKLPVLGLLTAQERPLLPLLRTLRITNSFRISHNKLLCSLSPNVQELSTWLPSAYSPATSSSFHKLTLADLRTLEFISPCAIGPSLLRGFLTTTPKLEVFRMVWQPAIGANPTTVADSWEAIRICKGTLREIHIDVYDRGGNLGLGELVGERWQPLLQDFEQLENLMVGHLPLRVLNKAWRGVDRSGDEDAFFEDMLPKGIREVTLCGPGASFVPAVRRLAGAARSVVFPTLKVVAVVPPALPLEKKHAWFGGPREWFRGVGWLEAREALQLSGVRFDLERRKQASLSFHDFCQ